MTDRPGLGAVAISEHPDPGVAVGEAIGSIQDQLDRPPDLLLVLTTGRLSGHLGRICSAAETIVMAETVIGAAVHGIVAGGQAAGREAVVSLAGLTIDGLDVVDVGAAQAGRHCTSVPGTDRSPERLGLLLSPDPEHCLFTVADVAATSVAPPWPGLVVPVDPSRSPSVVMAGRELGGRGVGITFPAGKAALRTTDGAVEIGMPMVVTASDGHRLIAVDGSPPRTILLSLAESDGSFLDGPSAQFPPLRVQRIHRPEQPAVDVIAVDDITGSALLDQPLQQGELVQLVKHDPRAAISDVASALTFATNRRPDLGPGWPQPSRPWAFVVSSLPASTAPELARRAYIGLGGPGLIGALTPRKAAEAQASWPAAAALVVR